MISSFVSSRILLQHYMHAVVIFELYEQSLVRNRCTPRITDPAPGHHSRMGRSMIQHPGTTVAWAAWYYARIVSVSSRALSVWCLRIPSVRTAYVYGTRLQDGIIVWCIQYVSCTFIGTRLLHFQTADFIEVVEDRRPPNDFIEVVEDRRPTNAVASNARMACSGAAWFN
jgi:hypothetical protein